MSSQLHHRTSDRVPMSILVCQPSQWHATDLHPDYQAHHRVWWVQQGLIPLGPGCTHPLRPGSALRRGSCLYDSVTHLSCSTPACRQSVSRASPLARGGMVLVARISQRPQLCDQLVQVPYEPHSLLLPHLRPPPLRRLHERDHVRGRGRRIRGRNRSDSRPASTPATARAWRGRACRHAVRARRYQGRRMAGYAGSR